MRVQRIPKWMLGDRVCVYVPAAGDYGGEYSEEPVIIENVCVEPSEALAASGYVLADGTKALMFVDAVASPNAFAIPVGSLVEWEGERMFARSVAPYRVGGTVHHWEVQLA